MTTTQAATFEGDTQGDDIMEWADPPPAQRGKRTPPQWLFTLKSNPGRWAKIKTVKNATITTQMQKTWGVECSARKNGELYDIYARWPEEIE
jgi:hypothetical protein